MFKFYNLKGEKVEKKPGAVFDDKEVGLFKEAFEAFQVQLSFTHLK